MKPLRIYLVDTKPVAPFDSNAVFILPTSATTIAIYLSDSTGTTLREAGGLADILAQLNVMLMDYMKIADYDPNNDGKISVDKISGLSNLAVSGDYGDLLNAPILGLAAFLNTNAPNQLLQLNSSNLIDPQFLPNEVKDVIEANSLAELPPIGTKGTIYIVGDVEYRWGGTSYISFNSAPGSTDSVPEGTNNLYFTAARAAAAAPVKSVGNNRTGDVTASQLSADLGLGNAAFKNVGTGVNDVAAGLHAHAVGDISLTAPSLVGRAAAGAGAAQEITLGSSFSIDGGVLNCNAGSTATYTIPAIATNGTFTVDYSKGAYQYIEAYCDAAGINNFYFNTSNLDVRYVVRLFVKIINRGAGANTTQVNINPTVPANYITQDGGLLQPPSNNKTKYMMYTFSYAGDLPIVSSLPFNTGA